MFYAGQTFLGIIKFIGIVLTFISLNKFTIKIYFIIS